METRRETPSVVDARRLGYLGFLGLLFILSFAVPLIFAATMGLHGAAGRDSSLREDSVFPDARPITKEGGELVIKNGPTLTPSSGEDFIISAWVNLKKHPKPSEAIEIYSKLDTHYRSKPGYALFLTLEGDSVIPVFHWRDGDARRSGLLFSPFPVIPGVWTLFVATVLDGQFVGLHAGALVGEGEIDLKLLGGYDLEKPVTPESKVNLVFGDQDNGFRGKLGPINIIRGTGLNTSLPQILNDLSKAPLQKPALPSTASLSLYVRNGLSDESGATTQVVIKKEQGKRGMRKEEAAARESPATKSTKEDDGAAP